MTEQQKQDMRALADDYMTFLSNCHADRERVGFAKSLLDNAGFTFLTLGGDESLSPGDKFYYVNYEKNLVAGIAGNDVLEHGIVFVGNHSDYSHVDLKPNYLNEMKDWNMVTPRTYYYG